MQRLLAAITGLGYAVFTYCAGSREGVSLMETASVVQFGGFATGMLLGSTKR